MEPSPLCDPKIYPNDNVLKGTLGAAMPAWEAFTGLLKSDYPLIKPEWRYYNDGKSWLFKVVMKKSTVCWVKVLEKHFRIGFYFGSKASGLIEKSTLDARLKKQYRESEGKQFRPISIEVKKKSDVKSIKELIELKLQA